MRRVVRFGRSLFRPQVFTASLVALLLMSGVNLRSLHLAGPAKVILPPVIPEVFSPATIYASEVSHVDCARQACMALTFDDGPNPYTTPQILSELEAAHVKASFFVVGSRVPGSEAILQRMHRDGFEIGNHSWTHPDLTKLPPYAIREQVARTQAAVLAAGVPAPKLFRPPYGAVNNVVRANVPLTIAMWNNDPEDWGTPDPAGITTSVLAQAGPGRVVDLHDIDASTVAALPGIIQQLQARHYQLVTFSQLFNLTSATPGEYFGR